MSKKSYTKVLDRPVLKTPGIAYLSCRGPDKDCALVAQCQDQHLCDKIDQLREKQKERWMDIYRRGDSSCLWGPHGTCHRTCEIVDFLPRPLLLRSDNGIAYVLRYSCFKIDNMVRARDLVMHYYVSPFTAYRLAMSLLTLISWYQYMNIADHILLNNLLVDLATSDVLPIDWRKAECRDYYLTLEEEIRMYRQFAHVMIRFMGAKRTKSGWEFPPEYQDERHHEFTSIICEVHDEWPHVIPDEVILSNFLTEHCARRKDLPKRIVDSLPYGKGVTKQPLYELIPKIKEG